MKILRRILFIILCIVLLILSVGFLLPRKVHVERSLLISATPKSIFYQINTLKNWEKWSPWLQMDTTVKLIYSGPGSGTGATYAWISNNKSIGNGSLSIISSIPYDSIQLIMDYGENGKSTGRFVLQNESQNTKVTWSLDSDLGMNPLSRWFGLFSDHMIGPDLERGLSRLDQLLADLKIVNGYPIIDYDVPARILISIRDTASPGTVTPKLSKMYSKISGFLKLKNLPPAGSPIAVFHSYAGSLFDIEACIPVASIIEVPEGMKCYAKNIQKTIMVKYFGPYKSITSAYNAMQIYLTNMDLQVSGPGWEEYITNPLMEADSNKWQTNIYYPLN
jgi:effector-binding domain-containing protein